METISVEVHFRFKSVSSDSMDNQEGVQYFKDQIFRQTSQEMLCIGIDKWRPYFWQSMHYSKDHKGHTKILLEEAADKRKLQLKSLIKLQKKTAPYKRKMNIIAKLDESCKQIQERSATEKQKTQPFVKKVITLMHRSEDAWNN